jgi:hypothetical protein
MTYEPWAILREPEQQHHDAKARRRNSDAFEGEGHEPDGEEAYDECHHERCPA